MKGFLFPEKQRNSDKLFLFVKIEKTTKKQKNLEVDPFTLGSKDIYANSITSQMLLDMIAICFC